jgi:hypothetical protein
MPLLMLAGLLLVIALLARKARAVAKDAGIPRFLVTAGLGLAVR